MEDKKKLDNVIYIGKKTVRVYYEAIQIQFEEKGSKEVILKTRGKYIVTAFNVTEFSKRKDSTLEIKEIKSGSETFKDKEKDREIYVSTVEICLRKKEK